MKCPIIPFVMLAGMVPLLGSGCATSKYNLAVAHLRGDGVPQNNAKAIEMFSDIAVEDSAYAHLAQWNLAVAYRFGQGVPQDYEEAVKWYRKYTKPSDYTNPVDVLIAKKRIREISRTGVDVLQEDQEKVARFRKDAEQGDARAQISLGKAYHSGRGVPRHFKTAAEWYTKAADQGNADAQAKLGGMYQNGPYSNTIRSSKVPQNYDTARKWYTKAADQGNAEGQAGLGIMYLNGQGVPVNNRKAFELFRKAAEQGESNGQFLFGFMYATGTGVPKDYGEAFAWYMKAAEQGNGSAQRSLALMFGQGEGRPINKREAYIWARLAAEEEPDEVHVQSFRIAASKLSRAERLKADKLFNKRKKSIELRRNSATR